ncbi:MAG TPA: formylglycine-generating enzyme family protein [Pyrinomonadaceae bacterium]|nr:formylglycine-generating enzyme family protein [Pyrinomonadaceae bacterium]
MMKARYEDFLQMSASERDEFGRTLAGGLDDQFAPASTGTDVLPTLLHTATGMEFKYIPGGEFEMGFSETEEEAALQLCDPIQADVDEMRPVRRIKVEPFLMSRLPVLNELAGRFVKLDSTGEEMPAAAAFLTREEAEQVVERVGCQLPSEQQWEYACRAGTQTLFTWGDTVPPDTDLDKWLPSDFSDAGELLANGFGLYGLFTGEWCEDRYRVNYEDEAPLVEGSYVIRGGGALFWPWQDEEWVWCMSAMRMPSSGLIDGRCGFRLVRPV